MRIAFIPPTSLLMVSNNLFSDMHMAIASHILMGDAKYKAFYRGVGKSGRHIILDNGVWETGVACGYADLLDTALEINASEIVIPDVMKDMYKTLIHAESFLDFADSAKLPRDFKFMFVPQGRDWMEWLECYNKAMEMFGDRFHTIGIPKWLGEAVNRNSSLYGRVMLINDSSMDFRAKYDYHMLGMNSVLEIVRILPYKDYVRKHIRSIDTSLPFAMAQKLGGIKPERMDFTMESYEAQKNVKRFADYFVADEEQFDMDVLKDNLDLLDSLR